MHIGFLTPEYVMPGRLDGGLANYIRKVGLALTNRGHQVSVLVLSNQNARWQDDRITVYEVKHVIVPKWLRGHRFHAVVARILSARRLTSAVWKIHRANPFDILQASSYMAPGYALRRNGRIPLVCRVSSYTPLLRSAYGRQRSIGDYMRDWLEIRQVLDAEASFAPSRFMATTFARLEGYQPPQKPGADLGNWLSIINYMPLSLRKRLWRYEYKSNSEFSLDLFEREYDQTKYYSNAHKVQYMDMKTYLPFDILSKVDIASMIHSLEVRTPITDKNVFEFASTMPETLNIRKNQSGVWQGKLLLKKLAENHYPADFVHRNKMGFGVPIQKWFAKSESLYNEIQERLSGRTSAISDYFEPAVVRSLIKNNASGLIWLLLFLEEWMRQNKKCIKF